MSRATTGREAVIVSTARTPLAKSWKGSFNMTHGATLGAHAVKAAVERAGVDPTSVEDVIMGCAYPEGVRGPRGLTSRATEHAAEQGKGYKRNGERRVGTEPQNNSGAEQKAQPIGQEYAVALGEFNNLRARKH